MCVITRVACALIPSIMHAQSLKWMVSAAEVRQTVLLLADDSMLRRATPSRTLTSAAILGERKFRRIVRSREFADGYLQAYVVQRDDLIFALATYVPASANPLRVMVASDLSDSLWSARVVQDKHATRFRIPGIRGAGSLDMIRDTALARAIDRPRSNANGAARKTPACESWRSVRRTSRSVRR